MDRELDCPDILKEKVIQGKETKNGKQTGPGDLSHVVLKLNEENIGLALMFV